MTPAASKKLSAVVVCYRDAPAVPIMYERLRTVFESLGVDYEIIYVNDASPDNAREVLADLAERDPKVVVINHTRNFGSQSGFTSGMKVATGDAVILLDGDLQDPPELIEDFFREWQKGYEVVYGVRVRRDAPLLMRGGYKLFYRIFRALSYVPVPVDAGDFSLLGRRVVDVLNAMPEKNRFLRGLRAWAGFRQTGVAYVRPERMFGRSSNSLLGNLGWAAKGDFFVLVCAAKDDYGGSVADRGAVVGPGGVAGGFPVALSRGYPERAYDSHPADPVSRRDSAFVLSRHWDLFGAHLR